MGKKLWKKPELVVLVRGRPEEAVLAVCKDPSLGGVDPSDEEQACCTPPGDQGCIECSDHSES